MFGFTSGGCFITGIFVGFLIAAFVAAAALFYFKPDIKAQVMTRVEQLWGNVKKNVDTSIDAVKKAPAAEPSLGTPPRIVQSSAPVRQGTAPSASVPKSNELKGAMNPKEIKVSW